MTGTPRRGSLNVNEDRWINRVNYREASGTPVAIAVPGRSVKR
jgi:hypothetical protein